MAYAFNDDKSKIDVRNLIRNIQRDTSIQTIAANTTKVFTATIQLTAGWYPVALGCPYTSNQNLILVSAERQSLDFDSSTNKWELTIKYTVWNRSSSAINYESVGTEIVCVKY